MLLTYKKGLEAKYDQNKFYVYCLVGAPGFFENSCGIVIRSDEKEDLALFQTMKTSGGGSADCLCIAGGFKPRNESIDSNMKSASSNLQADVKKLITGLISGKKFDKSANRDLASEIGREIKKDLTSRNFKCHNIIGVFVMEKSIVSESGVVKTSGAPMENLQVAFTTSEFKITVVLAFVPQA